MARRLMTAEEEKTGDSRLISFVVVQRLAIFYLHEQHEP